MADNDKILEAIDRIEKMVVSEEAEIKKQDEEAAEDSEKLEKSTDINAQLNRIADMLEKTVSTSTSSSFAQREHLDKEIKDVTKRRTPFIDNVAVIPANGKTHEWDMVTALGSNATATAECGTPPANEATIARHSAQIKTFATRVEVCDLAQWAAKDYFDLQNLHLERGMRKILHDVETKVFYGDKGTTAAEFDGLYELVDDNAPDGNLINGSGATITTTILDNAIQQLSDQGADPSSIELYMGATSLRTLAALWSTAVTYNDPETGKRTFGYEIGAYHSPFGVHNIVYDPWITAANSPNTNADIFLLTMEELALAQSEPMYKLPTYRALTLAETQTVVWNVVLEMKVPHWQGIIYDTK